MSPLFQKKLVPATVAYMRVSTSGQLDGSGIDQQKVSIGTFMQMKGLKVDEWVTEDETGTTEDRTEIQRLLQRAKAGEIACIIVDRMDRFGRLQRVCESLFAQFEAAGVEVVFANLEIAKTPEGTMIRQIMGSVAEYQRKEWLQRMTVCRRKAAEKKGTHPGGPTPFGYRSVGLGGLEVVEKEARVVRRVFELRSAVSDLKGIADRLTAEGLRNREGGQIFAQIVKRILAREQFYRTHKNPILEVDFMHVSKEESLTSAALV